MPNIERRTFIKRAAAGGIALLGGIAQARHGPNTARAQATSEPGWPNRPVRFIVPLAPGGGLDFVARVVGETMSRAIGQQIVIENRTGAGGTIGIETAIKSPPDGYSVLVTNDNVASAPHILKLGVDYLNELEQIPVEFTHNRRAGNSCKIRGRLVSVRKHFESFESFVIQSGDLIREGHHRCGRRRTADVTTAANCDIRVT